VRTNQSINELSSAEVSLRDDLKQCEPSDMFARVKIALLRDGVEQPVFTGAALEATVDASLIQMRLQSGTSLTRIRRVRNGAVHARVPSRPTGKSSGSA
jgi:hypothetical protein